MKKRPTKIFYIGTKDKKGKFKGFLKAETQPKLREKIAQHTEIKPYGKLIFDFGYIN